MKSLEYYAENGQFGEADKGVNFCVVKQQLLKQYNEFLEVERQNTKQEKLKVQYRKLLNDVNLTVLQYNNMNDAQKLERSKTLVAESTKPFTWQEYRIRQILLWFKDQYPAVVADLHIDDKHTIKDENEFTRKFNQFEREDSTVEVEKYKQQNRFHKKLFKNYEPVKKQEIVFSSTDNTVVQKDIRYMALTTDSYLNYAKYLEENMAKLLKVYETEYETYMSKENLQQKEAARGKRKSEQEKLVARREKEQLQSDADKQKNLNEMKAKNADEKAKETAAKVKAEEEKKALKKAEDAAKKVEDERRAKLTPEDRKKEDDAKAATAKAGEEAKKAKETEELRVEKEKQIQQLLGEKRDIASHINDSLADEKNVDQFLWYVKSRNNNQLPGLDDVAESTTLSEPLKYWNRGLKTIAKGRVALVLLAGDSDLKWNFEDEKTPLGFQSTGLNSQKCLFQLFCEKVEAVQRLAHMYRPDKTNFMETARVHVYVMTNPDNDFRTRQLFRKHLNFGLWKANVHFFEQPQFPALNPVTGQIKLRDRLRLHMMPDGTGGFYDAVLNEKMLADWDFWGIKYVHVMGIDNLLGRPVDPTLVGMLRGIDGETPLEFVTKAVKVGEKDTIPRIVISDDECHDKLPAGKEKTDAPSTPNTVVRVVRAGDIKADLAKYQYGVYNDFVCNVEFVQKALDNRKKWETFHETLQVLPFYQTPMNYASEQVYFKKEHVTTDALKSLVYERDIYDAVVLVPFKRFGVLEVCPLNEYAPIKPEAGKSFADAAVQMSELHTRWLLNYGYQFEKVDIGTKADRLQKKVKMDVEQFKIFTGEKTVAQRQFELKLKSDCKAKLAKNKKLRKINEMLESSDDEDESQIKELSKFLVEIDARQSVHGENIPTPPVYQLKVKSSQEEELPVVKKFIEQDKQNENEVTYETYPFYLKCNERPIKMKLPWGLNEIYRYV